MVTAINEFDGLLRTTKQSRNDVNGQYVTAETTYDGLGRMSTVTNPHRLGGAETDGLTTMLYDGLSRVTKATTFNSNNTSTGEVKTDYFGTTVTVTDQAGKQRKSKTDGLGRLIKVTEPLPSGVLGQDTTYQYDARGNLFQVNQGVQTRTFTYDALSRLKTAMAPESGTINYTYDKASNLKTRIDARGITITYTYDSLNRLVTKNYSDTTPDVDYFYDRTPVGLPSGANLGGFTSSFALGRLTGVATPTTTRQMATATFYSYDIGGRITNSDQLTQGQHYPTSVDSYNNLSLPTAMTYPSGKVLTHSYNDAGQLLSITRDSQPITDSVSYTAPGGVLQQHLGNGLYHSMDYNSRLQPTIIALGTSANGLGDKLRMEYDYDRYDATAIKNASTNSFNGTSGKNNGNIGHIRIYPGLRSDNPGNGGGGGFGSAIAKADPNHIKDKGKGKGKGNNGTYNLTIADLNAPFEQYYGYDELNRLTTAKEFGLPFVGDTQTTAPSVTSFTPDFGYPGDNVIVNITGINLGGTQSVSVSPNNGGVSASVIGVSETSVSLSVSVATNATPGQYALTLLNPLGTTSVGFQVLCVQVTLDNSGGQLPPLVGNGASNPAFTFTNLANVVGPARLAEASNSATFKITNKTNSTLIAAVDWRTLSTTEPNTGAIVTFGVTSSTTPFIGNAVPSDTLVVNTDGNGVITGNGDGPNKNRHDNDGENTLRFILNPNATELITITFSSTNVFPTGDGGGVLKGVTESFGFATILTSCVDINAPVAPSIKDDGISPQADAQPTVLWHEDYEYDRYGNRTNLTTKNIANQDVLIPINASNNRLDLPSIQYDPAGNVIADGQGNGYEYDAENHMIKAFTSGNLQGSYFYDGQGKRVQKSRFNEIPETTFVYGIGGGLWAEYATVQPTAATPDKEYIYGVSGLTAIFDSNNIAKYLTPDHLGSNRIVTDGSGTVVARYDFLPFGADMGALGSRAGITGYAGSNDQTRQKFTGYERDDETGLDFAQARYFGSMQGRFLSPDPSYGSANYGNPQSWNRYVYVSNNPLRFTDPSGLYEFDSSATPEERQFFNDSISDLKDLRDTYAKDSKQYKRLSKILDAYGEEGKGGPTIYFGLPSTKGASAEVSSGFQATIEFTENGKTIYSFIASPIVVFDLSNGLSVRTVAHEGQHLSDFYDFYSSLYIGEKLSDISDDVNITSFETEDRAYEIAQLLSLHQNIDLVTGKKGEYTLYNPEWLKMGIDINSTYDQMKDARRQLLKESSLYLLSPDHPGGRYIKTK